MVLINFKGVTVLVARFIFATLECVPRGAAGPECGVSKCCGRGVRCSRVRDRKCTEKYYSQACFLDIRSKTQGEKKLKLKLKKLKTQDFFAQNSKFRQFFQKFKKIFTQILQFSSKIRQNCSKTQEFTQNSR